MRISLAVPLLHPLLGLFLEGVDLVEVPELLQETLEEGEEDLLEVVEVAHALLEDAAGVHGLTLGHFESTEDNRKILIREFKGVIVSEKVFWNSRIGHPDCFLLPIRPPEDGKTIEISNDLKIERTDYANV